MEFLDSRVLLSAAENLGIEINDGQLEKLEIYARLLCQWNEKMNLTAITSPEGIALLHFADSLTLLRTADFKEGASFADVGTGAGFPSIPLAVMRPDMHFTLIDSLNKRLTFLDAVKSELGLNFETVHGRAEELGRAVEFREKFDYAAARAVAGLNVLCEYCLPFVNLGGIFLAMKGPSGKEEAKQAESAVKILGGKIGGIKEFSLDQNARQVVVIEKTSPTPAKYPRQSGKIKKAPL